MSSMKVSLLIAAFAAALVSSASAQLTRRPCVAAHYKITLLPFHPAGINSSGVIAGTTEDRHPATWSSTGGLREIELPEEFTAAEPAAINRAGEVVGAATHQGSEQSLAFDYLRRKFSVLSKDRSKAMAINDAGDVVGQSAERLVVWRKQKALPLGGCCGGVAHAINNRGQVVGELNDKDGHYSAFVWDATHGLSSIAPSDTRMSTALAINDAGDVLLQSFMPNAVYLRQNGKLTAVHLSPEFASQPLALNNCNVIVGEFGAASDFYHAFLWDEKSGFRDLNQLITAAAGWTLESALDINDRGEIIGVGDHGNEQDAGFLLVPDQESTSTKVAK
jgi:probable HAF family extracellular repeat protein